ncbi:MAG: hypothetical protein AAF577_10745 [Pseudomonadota bacterium]
MAKFPFMIFWTALSCAFLWAFWQDESVQDDMALMVLVHLFPLFGLIFMWVTWPYWRRRRSLRIEETGGVTVYIWIELDGSERRSETDPREEWDSSEGDSDGDGGD